jgi:phenylacetate-coenzyme A ligase PaaK-like adenylate-forming protein
MAAIDELREYFAKLRKEGSLRTDYPPKREEKYFDPVVETLPRDKLEKLRDERIRYIVKWAYEKSPFYRKMWDEAKVSPNEIHGYDDLEKLPFWRKDLMRKDQVEHPPFGTRAVKELIPYVTNIYRSTGTTGTRSTQPWTNEEWEVVKENYARMFWSAGLRTGGLHMHVVPPDVGYLALPLFHDLSRDRLGCMSYIHGLGSFMADPKGVMEFLSQFVGICDPIFTPGSLLHIRFGEQLNEIGWTGDKIPINLMNLQGQPFSARMRERLGKLWGARTVYGNSSSEGYAFSECQPDAEKGIGSWHMWEDLWVVEALDPETGKRVAKDERGESVVTSLFNHTVPLIRFSMEDVIDNEYTIEPCECGITMKKFLKPISGRTRDVFKVRGKTLMPWDVELLVSEIPETTMLYQITLDDWDMDSAKVKVETTRKLPDTEYGKGVRAKLEEGLGVPVELELLPPGGVPFMAGGYKVINVADNRPKKD